MPGLGPDGTELTGACPSRGHGVLSACQCHLAGPCLAVRAARTCSAPCAELARHVDLFSEPLLRGGSLQGGPCARCGKSPRAGDGAAVRAADVALGRPSIDRTWDHAPRARCLPSGWRNRRWPVDHHDRLCPRDRPVATCPCQDPGVTKVLPAATMPCAGWAMRYPESASVDATRGTSPEADDVSTDPFSCACSPMSPPWKDVLDWPTSAQSRSLGWRHAVAGRRCVWSPWATVAMPSPPTGRSRSNSSTRHARLARQLSRARRMAVHGHQLRRSFAAA